MGSMTSTRNKGKKVAAAQGKAMMDFDSLVRAGRTEYKNSMVEAASAEVYALRYVTEELYKVVAEQARTMADMQMQINALQAQSMKPGRASAAVDPEYTVAPTTEYEEWLALRMQYSRGVNIMWNCGVPPVDIAFNEFNIFMCEKKLYSMFTVDDVKANWSTLHNNCKKLTGMTLGKLMLTYARSRRLNY